MPSIKSVTQASGYISAHAGEKKKDDRFEHVICWTVIEFEEEDEPDEVVGQIFDGTCITEATSVDEEEGYGEFVGYFRDNEKGREEAVEACRLYRERLEAMGDEEEEEEPEEEEEDEDPPKKKKKNKKKKPVEEEEDEEESDDEEEEEEEDDFGSWESEK